MTENHFEQDAVNDGPDIKPVDKPLTPKKKFIGKRAAAADRANQQNGSVRMIEETTLVQGTVYSDLKAFE